MVHFGTLNPKLLKTRLCRWFAPENASFTSRRPAMVWESLVLLAGSEGIEKDMETTMSLRSRSYGLGFAVQV